MDVKIVFQNGDQEEKVYMDQFEGFFHKKTKVKWCVKLRSQYMD